jgi:hypothetical protein
MVRKRHISLLMLVMLLCSPVVWAAASSWSGFDAPSSRGTKLPPNYNGFHFEDKSNSSQGWMHLVHLKDGGWLTILFTAANLGPYKLSPSLGVLYAHPNGTKYTCSGMWPDYKSFTKPKDDRYWIGVNHSFFGGRYPNFYVKLNDGGCTSDISFQSIVPSFMQGSGKAHFYDDRSATWSLTQISPRAKASGWIQFPQAKINVEGDAYLEEVSADIMVPVMSDRWYILRTVNGPYTLNLFDIVVDRKNFSEGHIRTLLVARDSQILMGTTQFRYEPYGGRKDAESGIVVPEGFSLNARDGATTLTGSVKTGKILETLDLLSRLPRMARLFAGAMYGTPWQFRSAAEYDLVLKEGSNEVPIKGVGFSEIHYYDR